MGFAENQLSQVHVLWNYKTLSEPHNTKLIFGEALGGSVLDVLLDVDHSLIRLLGGFDPIHQGWLHKQGSEETVLNYIQVEALEFFKKQGLLLMEQCLVARGVSAHSFGAVSAPQLGYS